MALHASAAGLLLNPTHNQQVMHSFIRLSFFFPITNMIPQQKDDQKKESVFYHHIEYP
jgi:hypothetical protein